MPRSILYFAYGSNMHPLRLRERVASARAVGVATLPQHRLRFHKRGMDGSGKCDAHYTGDRSDKVHGVVYAMHAGHRLRLDRAEGRGRGYRLARVRVRMDGRVTPAVAYLAQTGHIDSEVEPYDWYCDLVLAGARWHGLPAAYLGLLALVSGTSDRVAARADRHRQLIEIANRVDAAAVHRRTRFRRGLLGIDGL